MHASDFSEEHTMAVRLGDTAPDFSAPTTQGDVNFHEWLGDSWGVLFSHPKDFTPVCTTELGYVAKIKPEFDKRNVKVIGLSVDPVDSHEQWEGDIEETQGTAVNFPMIGDPDRTVADLYDMIHPNADDTLTVRSVFVIGPDKKVKLTLTYPASTGRNFDEILRVIDSLAAHRREEGGDPGQLARRRRRDHRARAVQRGSQASSSPTAGTSRSPTFGSPSSPADPAQRRRPIGRCHRFEASAAAKSAHPPGGASLMSSASSGPRPSRREHVRGVGRHDDVLELLHARRRRDQQRRSASAPLAEAAPATWATTRSQ